MDPERARARFTAARVAHLATTGSDGPHVVPIVFAIAGDRLLSAVDHKPKTTTRLKRLDNITHDPRVAILADSYADDWDMLWWVRIDGHAGIVPAADAAREIDALAAKYPQYRDRRPVGPVIVVDIDGWRGWEATPQKLQ